MYKGVALFPDGHTVEVVGTIQECACWADNVIRARLSRGGENIRIDIREEEDERKAESETGR